MSNLENYSFFSFLFRRLISFSRPASPAVPLLVLVEERKEENTEPREGWRTDGFFVSNSF